MPAKKKAPKRERVAVQKLRTLGDVEPSGKAAPKRPKADKALAAKARATLQHEFDRALALKEKLAAEASIGAKEKGRESLRQSEKLRSIVASLEGMNRFALAMGLISPAESRELYAAAMKRGLYEGWR
ncbi:MAG: hypothetical protein E6G04_11980 [Actinobacteria bacterium]|nr:MAG: hypothetical protein E6G04_11980 [Actinomycetota bacterium]